MAKRNVDNLDIIKKGEAGTLLGFSTTAGYKYLNYLERNKLIEPIFLPGMKVPRYRKEDVLALLDNDPPSNLPVFEPSA
tara:strand:+ start:909 stop:1145 length:237 start_codon:yes stop_codon:yes gene_type:complete